MKKVSHVLLLSLALLLVIALPAMAYANRVDYRGQGLMKDDFGGYDLEEELCGIENGAEVDGPYLLWVLTATKSSNADITGPWGTAEMTKFGKNGVFKYVSAWYDPDTLIGEVYATYDGAAKNAQLVISHGCRPYTEQGAWCSPGFWKNAKEAAWTKTGYTPDTLFNDTVYPYWFGATFEENPSLGTVLANPPTYSGKPVAGTSGYELNAFNATGAFLTNNIPGFDFSWEVMMKGGDEACPLDHHGNLKN